MVQANWTTAKSQRTSTLSGLSVGTLLGDNDDEKGARDAPVLDLDPWDDEEEVPLDDEADNRASYSF